MPVRELIETVLSRLGLDEASPNADGAYEVVFDDRLDLQILPLEETLVLVRSSIGAIPSDSPADREFLADVLRRNLANLRRQSELITIDRTQRVVWLYRLVRLRADRTDDAVLLPVLEDFVDSLEWWRSTTEARPASMMSSFPFLRP